MHHASRENAPLIQNDLYSCRPTLPMSTEQGAEACSLSHHVYTSMKPRSQMSLFIIAYSVTTKKGTRPTEKLPRTGSAPPYSLYYGILWLRWNPWYVRIQMFEGCISTGLPPPPPPIIQFAPPHPPPLFVYHEWFLHTLIGIHWIPLSRNKARIFGERMRALFPGAVTQSANGLCIQNAME